MRICYLFNSSVPSHNPSSLQVIKTCEGLIQLKHKVHLITPNTGLKYNSVNIEEDVIKYIINKYCRQEKGVRDLLHKIEDIVSKVNLFQMTQKHNSDCKIKLPYELSYELPIDITEENIDNMFKNYI